MNHERRREAEVKLLRKQMSFVVHKILHIAYTTTDKVKENRNETRTCHVNITNLFHTHHIGTFP